MTGEHRRRRSPWVLLVAAVVLTCVAGAAVAVGRHGTGASGDGSAPHAGSTVRVAAGTAEQPLTVLLAGDSITDGYYASDRAHSYAALLTAYWRGRGPVSVTTVGLPGARTYAIARAMASHLADHPDLVVVEAGTNDEREATPLDEFTTTYDALLAAVHERDPDAALVCAGVWGSGPRARAFDAVVERACTAAGGAYRALEPLFAVRADRGTAGYPTWRGPADTFHPDDAGHAAIARTLAGAVELGPPG